MGKTISLRDAKPEQQLRIVRITAQGEMGRRIRDMGLIPNTEMMVIGKAPLRDPVALRMRDFTLSLRNSEADHIAVEVVGGSDD
ncbi:MAG: FeoA family protein [Desulfovibrio sp.]